MDARHVVVDKDLYAASATALLGRFRGVGEDVRSVLVIGHNPGLQDLVAILAGDGDDDAMMRAREKFPTAALATLSFPAGAWDGLGPGRAHLESLVVPRHLD